MYPRTRDQTPGSGARGLLLALGMAVALVLMSAPVGAVESDFPVSIVDDEGTALVIEHRPERIVSLSPANTEIVFALGAEDRMAGGTDADAYPPEAAELTDVVAQTVVLTERIVQLAPDLILAEGNAFTPPADVARLRQLGYPVAVFYSEDVDAVLERVDRIGLAVGAGAAGEALAEQMRRQLDTISAAATATGSAPRTFYEIFADTEIYGPAPDSFIADMIALAGGDPITTGDPALYAIPLEALVLADPEVIVLGDAPYGVCPAAVDARPGWSEMTAVVNGDIHPVDGDLVTLPGPRLPQALADLARAIHGDIALDGFAKAAALCEAAGP